jgi:hypothetical protein
MVFVVAVTPANAPEERRSLLQEHLDCQSGQAQSEDTSQLDSGRELRNGASEIPTHKKAQRQ